MDDHGNKAAPADTRQLPLWLVAAQPSVLRVRFRDWLWLRRVAKAQAIDPGESIADYIVRTTVEQDNARDLLEDVREAHEWQCDCTRDDPCRIAMVLNGGAA